MKQHTKIMVIIGGGLTDVGKTVTAASLALLLHSCGFKVQIIKFDGYLNLSEGNMNPYHKKPKYIFKNEEIFVLKDGFEGGKDLGYYERFLELSANLGVEKVKVNRIISIYGCRSVNQKYTLTPYEYRELILFAKEKGMEYGIEVSSEDPITFQIFRNKLLKNKKFAGCGAGIIHLHINSRGEVFPCPYLPIRLGSIREERICDILTKHKVWEFSMIVRLNLTGKCGQCKNKMICGGCRAAAFSIRGNILDSDPLCFNV